eukprot:11430780-Alexandrium_andersonii.AAC.1
MCIRDRCAGPGPFAGAGCGWRAGATVPAALARRRCACGRWGRQAVHRQGCRGPGGRAGGCF